MKKLSNDPRTIEVSWSDVPSKFKEMLARFEQSFDLKDVEAGIHECFVTETDAPKLFGGKKTIYVVICFHNDFLLWSTIQDKKSDGVACAKWSELSAVTEWEDSEKAKLADLHGVEVFGFLFMRSQRSTSFLALDKSVSGLKCRQLLKERIVK